MRGADRWIAGEGRDSSEGGETKTTERDKEREERGDYKIQRVDFVPTFSYFVAKEQIRGRD